MSIALFVGLSSGCKGIKGQQDAYERAARPEKEKEYDFTQNFTAKYNILYHSRLMLDNERDAIFNSATKNYQIRQTVFDEPTGEGDAHVLMDSLIGKAYKIIDKKQESKYVNEAYFILGKANYLKGAYHTSIEFFNHLLRSADEQKGYLPLAFAWKSRALLQIGKADQAKVMIDSAFMAIDGDKSTRTFVNAAMANYLIRTGNESDAIPYLEYALESNTNRLDKRRWQFLLAQLYKERGNTEQALAYFSKISKSNVPYDMAFEASLQSSFLKGQKYANVDDQVKPLLKMLREGKNDGYQDQILFQAGDIYFQKGKPERAIDFYKRSLAQPNRNNYQATETYLKLGEYYFDQKRYLIAQNYYDSAAMILPADFTDANKVRKKLGYMGEITRLFFDVSKSDTLLSLASLDEQKLHETVSIYAAEQLEDARRQQIQVAQSDKKKRSTPGPALISNAAFQLEQRELISGSASGQAFYFNNPDERLLGQTSFRRRWGNRQLKDNWRYEADQATGLNTHVAQVIEQKPVVSSSEEPDDEAFLSAIKESYLKAVPKSKSSRDSIDKKVHDNLIVIGNIYRENAKDNLEAIRVYEELLRKYPDTPEGPSIYYSLYRMYDEIDKKKAEYYKDKLVALFPLSLHAKVAQDPAYMDKYRRDKNILDRLFERLYTLYAQGDHAEVIAEADRELQGRFENSALVAQVEYLRALAVGRVGRVQDFTQALANIIKKYPSDSLVTPLAKENRNFIEQNPDMFVNRVNALQDIDKSRVAFVDEPNMTPWPLLDINGDYRTGVALAVERRPAAEPVKPLSRDSPKVPVKKDAEVAKVEEKKELSVEETVAVIEEKERGIKAHQIKGLETGVNISLNQQLAAKATIEQRAVDVAAAEIDLGPNNYRDKKLFPDVGDYYFVINVLDAKVNLAPSRYGIGQFNRTRHANSSLSHQLKVVNGENQLVFVGPFKSFEEVKSYEARILPMMAEIMKVPTDIYNTFVIVKELIPSLEDGVAIQHYYQNYIEQ